MASGPKYLAFWSYTRFDDKNDDKWVTGLRKALVDEVRALFGKRIEIFQDIDGIAWGERWKEKLISSSDDAVFLIPVITPTYFESEACRQELEEFVERERATGFQKLILPLYYIDAQQLEDQFKKGSDYLAQIVAEHTYGDVRKLRTRGISSHEAKQKIKALATGLMERLDEYALRQLSTTDMRALRGTAGPRKGSPACTYAGDA